MPDDKIFLWNNLILKIKSTKIFEILQQMS